MRILTLLLMCAIAHASSLESAKDDLDVSTLPKEFREWHVRIVGEGYLRFLVPTSMEVFANSTGDEEAIYIQNALHTDSSDPDIYSMREYIVVSTSNCSSSDNIPPAVLGHQTVAGNCVSQWSLCEVIVGGTNETTDVTEKDATTCVSVEGSCMEKSGETATAAAAANSVAVNGWNLTTHVEGECTTSRTIMLDSAVTGYVVGDKLTQDFGAADGSILGVITSVSMAGQEYIVNDIVGTAGTSTVVPTDFTKGTDGGPVVTFIKTYGTTSVTTSVTTRKIILQMIRTRTFTAAVMRRFVPYIQRTFIPAVLSGVTFAQVYSRYGLLHVNKYRLLVNVNGLLVIGKTKAHNEGYIHVPEFYNSVTIRQNGQMNIKYNDGTSEYVGQLTLVTFPNKYGLNIWGGSGFEIRCNGAGGFGTSLGSWCKNTNLDGKTMWYYASTVESGDARVKLAAPFSPTRLQQYHLNTMLKDLYLGGKEPQEIW
jgi:hypothetical protein